MKKFLLIVLAVLVVLVGSALWILRGMGVSDAALLLPEETVALVALPDLPRSVLRWPQTTLAKIGVEPQMKAFLEKPLQFLTKNQGGDEASGVLWQLKPGRIFAAVTSVTSQETSMLVGFQYWGGKVGHEAAIARLRQELAQGGQPAEVTKESYEGTEVSSSRHGTFTLYNASHGQWGFLSNSLPTLKAALDRAAGRNKAGSLAESARYKQVAGHLSADPDFLVYVQPQSALDSLLAIGAAMGAQTIPAQIEQARKVEAIGFTTKMDGANLKDTIFVLRPNPPDIGSLGHGAMKFTSADTTLFFNFTLDFRQLSTLGTNPALPGVTALQSSRLFTLIPEAFGPECGAALSWLPGAMKPDGVIAVQVKDQVKAEEALQEILSFFPESNVADEGGIRTYSFPALQTALANPTIGLTEGWLLLGLGAEEISRATANAKAGTPLEKAPAFAPALTSFRTANEVFGYVDSKAIFERGFPMLRPVLIFSAALMPGVAEVIDTNKIPDTETIAKHLQPILYSQTRLSDGYLIESSGPITMNQAALIGAGAGSAFFKPQGDDVP